MAYIDHASTFAIAGGAVSADAIAFEPQSGFSPLEWTVIRLAQRDTLSTLGTPGPIARAFGSLFGLGRKSILADPRLEALRRVAVYAWRQGYQLPVSEIKRFLAAGFSSEQFETLIASIGTRRAAAGQGSRASRSR